KPEIVAQKPDNQLNIHRIISVFHITVDEKCNRLFFMDNGNLQYYRNTTYLIQNPALWVFELPLNGCVTRKFPVIRRVELPNKITAKGANGFMHVVLDYQSENTCDDLVLYITNAFYSYLTVYDYKKDQFWTFEHHTFQPVIAESHFIFRNTFDYDMPLGLFSLTLGYRDKYGDNIAYYTSVAGTAQYAVSTKLLKDRTKSPANFNPDDFRIMGYRGCNHEPLRSVIDYTYGVMFTSEVQSNEIRCWNINKPLNPDNIDVVYKSDKLFFGPQMFIDSRGYLWFESSHIPVLYFSDIPLDLNQVNGRLFRIKVSDAIRGTVCEDDDQYRLSDLYVK
ncbi:L-dopachrome tautomerase yellow-f2-like, partial [Phlebotomus papatasi]|uniref:L-dopachrome tautomerase yellow-f2-like n=1 Tax=Phlebotomus papatasi TaxID=29031 RepID=UPI00248339EF